MKKKLIKQKGRLIKEQPKKRSIETEREVKKRWAWERHLFEIGSF